MDDAEIAQSFLFAITTDKNTGVSYLTVPSGGLELNRINLTILLKRLNDCLSRI